MTSDPARQFFTALFGDAVDASRVLSIFTLPGGAVRFFSDTARAAEYAVAAADQRDVYFGCGLYRPGVAGRGTAAEVACITSAWADIDFGPNSKKAIPPDEAAARGILARILARPSILVHSGHGLHPYWRLREPWVLDSPQEAQRAAAFTRRFVATLQAAAQDAGGWTLDSVGDLARILRVPGTVNRKNGENLPVRLLEINDDPGLDPDNFAQYLVDDADRPVTAASAVITNGLILDPSRSPPFDLIDALLTNDPKFLRTWRRRRTDLKDGSASAYDLAVANACALAGWTDQSIYDAMVTWRRKHGESDPGKMTRPRYVADVMAKARAGKASLDAIRELDELRPATELPVQVATKTPPVPPVASKPGDLAGNATQATETPTAPPVTPESPPEPTRAAGPATGADRTRIIDLLRKAIGIGLVRWVQHGDENANYSLILADGRDVLIGNAEDVLNQRRFRAAVYEATGQTAMRMKEDAWTRVCNALGRVADKVANLESSRQQFADDLVGVYLQATRPVPEAQWQTALEFAQPFERGGFVHVNLNEVQKFAKLALGQRVERHVLWPALRAAGWEQVNASGRVRGKAFGKVYWRKAVTVEESDYDATSG